MKGLTWKKKILSMALIGCVIAAFGIIGVLSAFADWVDVHYTPNLIPAHPDVISGPDPPETGWEIEGGYHQHRSPHEVMAWGNDVFGQEGLGPGYYYAYSVWTNEQYNLVFNPNEDIPTREGSHGFIEEANDPDYYFYNYENISDWSSPVAQKAKELIIKAFDAYSNITLDDVSISKGLMTGLSFSETQEVDSAEIGVLWADIEEYGSWQYVPGSLGWYPLVFSSSYQKFYFGDNKDEFLDPAYNDVWDVDFYSIALHEVGHVLGLGHQANINDTSDIMSIGAGSKVLIANGVVPFQEIGADPVEGARDLYTSSTPEPPTGLMALLGLLPGVWAYIRRKLAK